MYKVKVLSSVVDMQEYVDEEIRIINEEHGTIISTSANDYHFCVFYEVPDEVI